MIYGCESSHGASMEAQPKVLDNACVSEALAPMKATIDRTWTSEDKAVYLVPGEQGYASVVFLHPKTGESTFTVAWSEPEQRTKSQTVAMHELMDEIYNRTSERCAGLPPLKEAKFKCWRSGCLG